MSNGGSRNDYNFWAPSFSNYITQNYDFSKAKIAASLQNLEYEIANGYTISNVSYIVEPVNESLTV
jgi:hypothetical protein